MKHMRIPLLLEVRLGFAAHQVRAMVQGFDPVPFRRFQSVAILYGKW